jgi:ribosomal protein S18 acetylase RimI-like enzyme
MEPLRLRDAGPQDAETVARLHAQSWRRHYRGAYADRYLDGDLLGDRLSVWSARLADPAGTVTLLAELDGHAVGFVRVVFDADERWGSLVDNLHIAPDSQRRGVGRALLRGGVEPIARRADRRAIYLYVLEQNTNAQGFYRALGGVPVERAPVPPGDRPERLNGTPYGLRFAWPDAAVLA